MDDNNPYFAQASILIRKPVNEVFEAFTDPDITTHFWFTHGSSRLEEGKIVEWKWEMYNLEVPIHVTTLNANSKIIFDWGAGTQKSTVVFDFESRGPDRTAVMVKNYGFQGNQNEVLDWMRDSTGGFNLVLAAAKAWLEHGIELKVVEDKV